MNYSNYILFDFETTSPNPEKTQIVQIAAICCDMRTLSIKQGSEFNCLVKPLYGEEAATAGVDELTDGAINVHGKTHDMLKDAPPAEVVIKNFCEYVAKYNWKTRKPIPVTYNGIGFDLPILKRYLNEFGLTSPFDRIFKVDMMDHMFTLFENDKNVRSLSMDNLFRGYFGYKDQEDAGAHDALGDVRLLHTVFSRYVRLTRKLNKTTKFEGSLSEINC